MKQNPLVSICIPTFNAASFINETINDCLIQTYPNIEIIISDNCSTDNTISLIEAFNDNRIKIFRNSRNEGLLFNFKKVFTYATGKYMTFLGADDGLDKETISKAVSTLEAPGNSGITLVNSFIQVIDGKGKPIFTKRYFFRGGEISSYWGIRSNFLIGTGTLGEPNGSVFRKTAYDNIPEPKLENGNEWTVDIDLKIELLLQGSAYMIPEPLGKFRISNKSTSTLKLKFVHAKLFRKYALTIYRDRRYNLSFFWILTATVNSFMLEVIRNIFYLVFITRKNNSE